MIIADRAPRRSTLELLDDVTRLLKAHGGTGGVEGCLFVYTELEAIIDTHPDDAQTMLLLMAHYALMPLVNLVEPATGVTFPSLRDAVEFFEASVRHFAAKDPD